MTSHGVEDVDRTAPIVRVKCQSRKHKKPVRIGAFYKGRGGRPVQRDALWWFEFEDATVSTLQGIGGATGGIEHLHDTTALTCQRCGMKVMATNELLQPIMDRLDDLQQMTVSLATLAELVERYASARRASERKF